MRPLIVVVDTNVFGRNAWIRPILRAADDRILIPVWSPLIISEVNRLLTWLWIKRHGDDTSEAARRRCSADFKTWYANVAVQFHVVEDRPPLADMWTDTPPDPWDAPIWTAAVRARALFATPAVVIVTDNLKDGPPPNEHNFRVFDDVPFVHPSDVLRLVSGWQNLAFTAEDLPDDETQIADGQPGRPHETGNPGGIIEEFLRSLGLTAEDNEADSDSS